MSKNPYAGIPILGKINRIIKLIEMPCGPSYDIFVETFAPAAFKALIAYVSPGKLEIVRFRQGRGSSPCGFKQLFDAEAEEIPAYQQAGVRFIIRLIGLAERALFYWMLIDIAEEFVINWTTLAYKRAGCDIPLVRGPCKLSNGLASPLSTPTHTVIRWDTVEYDPAHWASAPPRYTIEPDTFGAFNVLAGISVDNGPSGGHNWTAKIVQGTGQETRDSQEVYLPFAHDTSDLVLDATINIASAFDAPIAITLDVDGAGFVEGVKGGYFAVYKLP